MAFQFFYIVCSVSTFRLILVLFCEFLFRFIFHFVFFFNNLILQAKETISGLNLKVSSQESTIQMLKQEVERVNTNYSYAH